MDQNTGTRAHQFLSFKIPGNVLDDLCSRFIINVPEEERQDLVRIFFQIELAHWFYLDFFCEENANLKPVGIKEFSAQTFAHCPFLRDHAPQLEKIFDDWKQYKMAVPTYGAILVNPSMRNVVMVQGFWAKSSWMFPKGKVNEDEEPHLCAVREVLEETGYDISDKIKEDEYLEYRMNDQYTRLYIVQKVPDDNKFAPRTRKEIKRIEWFPVEFLPGHKNDIVCKDNLGLNPNSFFMVIPFIRQLRLWVGAKSRGERFDFQSANCSVSRRRRSTPARSSVSKSDRNSESTDTPAKPNRTSDKSKRSLTGQFEKQTKQPELVAPKSWLNFKFDIQSIMNHARI